MGTWAILATGPSMSQALADSVRGRCRVVAVSDSWQLAPWADALASVDAKWWREKSPGFNGPKFTLGKFPDIEQLTDLAMGSNSGLLGIHVAVKLGATKVLLLGFDLQGTHYFGPHTGNLKNSSPTRVAAFQQQFANYKPRHVEILNCNPNSKLKCYPMARLEEHLEGMVEPAASGIESVGCVQCRTGTAGLRSPVRGHFKAGFGRHYGELEPNQGGGAGG